MVASWHGNYFYITDLLRGIHCSLVDFPRQWPAMRRFDVFFVDNWNHLLNKQLAVIWDASCDVTVRRSVRNFEGLPWGPVNNYVSYPQCTGIMGIHLWFLCRVMGLNMCCCFRNIHVWYMVQYIQAWNNGCRFHSWRLCHFVNIFKCSWMQRITVFRFEFNWTLLPVVYWQWSTKSCGAHDQATRHYLKQCLLIRVSPNLNDEINDGNIRQGDCPGLHRRRWRQASTSPVNTRATWQPLRFCVMIKQTKCLFGWYWLPSNPILYIYETTAKPSI